MTQAKEQQVASETTCFVCDGMDSECPRCGRPRMVEALRELIEAVEEQDDLDPTNRLVQAVRDAKAWVEFSDAVSRAVEASPTAGNDSAAISDRANEEGFLDPLQGPQEGQT